MEIIASGNYFVGVSKITMPCLDDISVWNRPISTFPQQQHPPNMRYSESITDFFRSPNWLKNLLFGGLCVLIPAVGPLALIGYHAMARYGRDSLRDPASYPDFVFDKFGTYLERGVWPFLVNLVVGLVMSLPMALLFGVVGVALASMAQGKHNQDLSMGSALLLAICGLGFMGVSLLANLVIKPMMIRAVITQDFKSAFDLAFVRSFVSRTWVQQLVALLFLIVSSMALTLVGTLLFCVGMYAAIAIVMFSQAHLDRQLYDLYLARGGEPVPPSPTLLESSLPPALPLA
jgi:hypothetical protein